MINTDAFMTLFYVFLVIYSFISITNKHLWSQNPGQELEHGQVFTRISALVPSCLPAYSLNPSLFFFFFCILFPCFSTIVLLHTAYASAYIIVFYIGLFFTFLKEVIYKVMLDTTSKVCFLPKTRYDSSMLYVVVHSFSLLCDVTILMISFYLFSFWWLFAFYTAFLYMSLCAHKQVGHLNFYRGKKLIGHRICEYSLSRYNAKSFSKLITKQSRRIK